MSAVKALCLEKQIVFREFPFRLICDRIKPVNKVNSSLSSRWQKRLKIGATCVCCLLPSLAVLGGLSAADSPARFTESRSTPALAMHIHMVHLREFDIREGKAIARFEFHNAGESRLKIRQIKPSCGCVTTRIHQPETGYAGGAAGEFYLEVDTASESAGLQEYDIKIEYQTAAEGQDFEKAEVESVSVLFRVEVPEKKVTVRPRALIFYQFSPEPTVQTVEVTDFRERKNFEILDLKVENSQGFVKAEGLKLEPDENGRMIWKFQVTASGEVPSGRQTSYVQMRTSDPEFPQLRLPILLYGPPEKTAQAAGEKK